MTSLIRAFRLGLLNFDFLRHVLKKDIKSGFVVGIIALPMSVGIALASGFPPFSGLLSSLIGGLFISFISGSRLCIKGPAGGLSALTLSSVLVLGHGDLSTGYSLTLAAIVAGGALQVLSAFARMGNLGDFFPAAAIHGMLAGLGFIMAVKQLPPMLGIADTHSDILSILQHLPDHISHANPRIAFIGLTCLCVLSFYRFLPKVLVNLVPSVIVMLAIAVPMGLFLGLGQEHAYSFLGKTFHIHPVTHLVNFSGDFLSTLAFPNFQLIDTLDFWVFALIFSLAGNIESLLTCKAVDQIDPWHRQSNFNQDLLAIGIGNIICGFLGGLPIISESKRSVVNIHLGGATFASNFFHAFFLLLFILFAQPFIRLIPVAALAAFLISTGIKMALPKEFSKSYQIGKEQLAVFVVVFLLTVSTNLLYGVLAGTLLELIINMQFGATSSSLFESNMVLERQSPYHYEAKIKGPATFSNFLWVKRELQAIPENSSITFDFSDATVVDHSFMENLSYFEAARKNHGGNISLIGLDYHEQVSSHALAARRMLHTTETERQKELQAFAEKNGLDFDKRRLTHPSKFGLFRLDPKLQVSYMENTVKRPQDALVYEFADIHCELNGVPKQNFDVTVLTINSLPDTFPNFQLLTEGFERKLMGTENATDINFLEFPAFSYYYFLMGENEGAVRESFSPELILFFEQHKGYNVSYTEGNLLVYKRADLLSTEEIEKMYFFADQLVAILFHR